MSNVYYVTRHGKRIAVVDMDQPKPKSARSSRRAIRDGFAIVPLAQAADVAKATDTPSYMVFTLLFYLAWKTKSSTFTLSNDCLKQFGVNRWAKYWALGQLEKAGIISVGRDPGKATVVTLLGAWGEALLK
jgi:hypothetical protein